MSNVQERLKSIPQKVSVPFQKLLSAGQLNEKVVDAALNAGELAGDFSKLIAFTAGMVYLQSQGIPVHDVIDMAKKQGRKINLGWSANRWKAEHERLSRAEALTRLAGENIAYDVSNYAVHLPRFRGYLIRTSRRLGMEGLRQRHCVATYHQQLLSGTCAIASVFINKQRWTVQLVLTGRTEVPFRIVQIKTRHNGHASKEIQKQIHDELGIEQIKEVSAYTHDRNEAGRSYMDNLRRVLPVLRQQAVERVTVRFDGAGDSGSIDSTEYEPQIDADATRVSIGRVSREFIQDEWRYTNTVEEVTLDEAIQAITEDYLDETGVDWYNNDGGFGDLVIDVDDGTVQLEVNVRLSESETAFSATREIETGDEIDE